MIKTINQDKRLKNYLRRSIDDAGISVSVDTSLSDEEYVGIKVDDYYMGLCLGETPKAVDYIVAVDCQCNSYVLYIIEFKNTKSPKGFTAKEIWEKFDTAVYRFMGRDFADIFMSDRYKYKDIKMYLVTSAYQAAAHCGSYMEYIRLLQKVNQKDSLVYDRVLSGKNYKFRNRILHIEREIPPNPVIRRITK